MCVDNSHTKKNISAYEKAAAPQTAPKKIWKTDCWPFCTSIHTQCTCVTLLVCLYLKRTDPSEAWTHCPTGAKDWPQRNRTAVELSAIIWQRRAERISVPFPQKRHKMRMMSRWMIYIYPWTLDLTQRGTQHEPIYSHFERKFGLFVSVIKQTTLIKSVTTGGRATNMQNHFMTLAKVKFTVLELLLGPVK